LPPQPPDSPRNLGSSGAPQSGTKTFFASTTHELCPAPDPLVHFCLFPHYLPPSQLLGSSIPLSGPHSALSMLSHVLMRTLCPVLCFDRRCSIVLVYNRFPAASPPLVRGDDIPMTSSSPPPLSRYLQDSPQTLPSFFFVRTVCGGMPTNPSWSPATKTFLGHTVVGDRFYRGTKRGPQTDLKFCSVGSTLVRIGHRRSYLYGSPAPPSLAPPHPLVFKNHLNPG